MLRQCLSKLVAPYGRGASGWFISHQSPKGLNVVSNAEFSLVSEK